MADTPPASTPPRLSGETSQVLASDQRRDQSVALLSAACADGRLALEDFSDRVDRALAARTVGELSHLEADLGPAPAPVLPGSVIPHRPPAWFVAVLSSTVRRGPWRLRPSSHALTVLGQVHLDLRGAEVRGMYSHITAVAVLGNVKVIVPEGINVEVDGLAVLGSKTIKGGSDHTLPGAPTMYITAVAVLGNVEVVTKGPKQSKLTDSRTAAPGDVSDRRLGRHQRHAARIQQRAVRLQQLAEELGRPLDDDVD